MLLNPAQEMALVKEPDIQVTVLLDPLVSKESPEADTVVKIDEDNVVARLLDDLRSVVVGVAICSVAWR